MRKESGTKQTGNEGRGISRAYVQMGEQATKYRAMTAQGIFLAQGRSDIQFAVKGIEKEKREKWFNVFFEFSALVLYSK